MKLNIQTHTQNKNRESLQLCEQAPKTQDASTWAFITFSLDESQGPHVGGSPRAAADHEAHVKHSDGAGHSLVWCLGRFIPRREGVPVHTCAPALLASEDAPEPS